MPAPGLDAFQYAIVRVVPHVERGECFNAGVVLFCRSRRFLAARVALDHRRLAVLGPDADAEGIAAHLDALVKVAAGEPDGGPVAGMEQSERFHWLVAPASTVLQASPVHTGLCRDPQRELERLFDALVLPVDATRPPSGA